jgi:hypothetical protein
VMVGVSHLVRPMIHEAISSAVGGRLAPPDHQLALPSAAAPGPGPATSPNGGAQATPKKPAEQVDGTDPTDPTVLRRLARFLDRIEDARGTSPPNPPER